MPRACSKLPSIVRLSYLADSYNTHIFFIKTVAGFKNKADNQSTSGMY